jgi:hypothetical protein
MNCTNTNVGARSTSAVNWHSCSRVPAACRPWRLLRDHAGCRKVCCSSSAGGGDVAGRRQLLQYTSLFLSQLAVAGSSRAEGIDLELQLPEAPPAADLPKGEPILSLNHPQAVPASKRQHCRVHHC